MTQHLPEAGWLAGVLTQVESLERRLREKLACIQAARKLAHDLLKELDDASDLCEQTKGQLDRVVAKLRSFP